MRKAGWLVVLVAVFLTSATDALAVAPTIPTTSVAEQSVAATSVTLDGTINPNGMVTTYRFEYLPLSLYETNLAADPSGDPFAAAWIAPANGKGQAGAGTSANNVAQQLVGLSPETAYRYRLRATNSAGESVVSVARPFATQPPTNAFELLDHRGWEMVSPIEKGGGAVQPPGTISGGGVFQAAAGGGIFTFSSADSFGFGAQGAPSGSQYLSARFATGWTTTNITTPMLSGSYGSEPDGVPYRLFSGDLGLALLSNGERCRGQAGGECPVANPPLPESGAPAGYRNYYRRTALGSFDAVLRSSDLGYTSLGPQQLELRVVATTSDLAHVVLSSCAALAPDATEISAPGGCDPAEQNLYEWSGAGLSLLNLLPGDSVGTTGAEIAAPSDAISADGSRAYFTLGGALYLRERNATKLVDSTAGAEFAGASADGAIAYVIDAAGLMRYSALSGTLTTSSAGPGVEGVLGVSADGSIVYHAESGAIYADSGGLSTEVAASAASTNWPASVGTARVSADGSHLLFLSAAELTGYPNEGATEAYLYGPAPAGGPATLTCVSCSPGGERPQGNAGIPGAIPNGLAPGAIKLYKPRDLSSDGHRVFFETTDSLVSQDTNGGVSDVYEWEADGEGTCTRTGGCVQLISGGRDQLPSYFLDADGDGGEAFFSTVASLYPLDPGSYDVYDAREGGGFTAPESPIPCVADACQVLPPAPEDPTPGTLVPNAGNPALTVSGASKKRHHPRKSKHRKKRRKHHGHRVHRHKGSAKDKGHKA